MSFVTSKKVTVDSQSLDDYLREIGTYPLIDRAEEARLAPRIRDGDAEALDQLVRANLRFVVSFVKKYQNQGVSLADLINEGNLGLVRAAYRFDETKGVKFISYAVWWIRQAILCALAEQSRIVRVPLSRVGALHRIGKRSSALSQELGREPTVDELADGLDLSRDEIKHTVVMAQSCLSLDAPLVPGEEGQLANYLSDHAGPGPDDEMYTRALSRSIDEALSTLDEREAKVLCLYFGLGDEEPLTLGQISVQFGLTKERVRQIKENGLRRLRHRSRARFLETFLL